MRSETMARHMYGGARRTVRAPYLTKPAQHARVMTAHTKMTAQGRRANSLPPAR